MRLIDADALIEQMEADAEQMEEPLAKMFAYAAINDVKHAPTVQPERKTGRWIPLSRHKWIRTHKCDQCGNILDFDGVNAGRGDANFCPNCGAVMRGDKNE